MIVFPLVATGVSGVFSALLLRQWMRKRRLPQLFWGIAMAQFAVASVAVALGTSQGWDPTLFRTYYLFGALLNVPWLALGSIALLGNKPVTYAATVVVGVLSVIAAGVVLAATVDPAIVGARDIPRGRVAFSRDEIVRKMAEWYSIVAYVVVVLIAVVTSRARGGVRPPRDRVRGNLLIAAGVSVVAIGSTALARLARGSVFSVTLAVGVSVMFVGFLYASRPPRAAGEDPAGG